MILRAPWVGYNICATVESYSRNEQVILKKFVDQSCAYRVQTFTRNAIVRKVSVYVNVVDLAVYYHSFFSFIMVITTWVCHRKNYDLPHF